MLYACMYVCVCVCMYVHTHTHTHTIAMALALALTRVYCDTFAGVGRQRRVGECGLAVSRTPHVRAPCEKLRKHLGSRGQVPRPAANTGSTACVCVCVCGGGGVSKFRDLLPTQNVRSATCCQHGYACILSFFIIIFSLFLSFLSYFPQPAAKTGLHVFYYNCY